VSRPGPLVLIVDDDARNRKLAADLLRLAGFGIIEAGTAREAIAIAADRVPDAILMDLRLPDLDGAQATRLLRADSRTAGVPVIALTALALDGDEDWLRAAGFTGHLHKPIEIEQFAALVHGFLPLARE
jgi:two-component system cell cycle response regulator DivK